MLIEKAYKDKIEIVPVTNIVEVIEHSLVGPQKSKIVEKLQNLTNLNLNVDLPDVVPA